MKFIGFVEAGDERSAEEARGPGVQGPRQPAVQADRPARGLV